MCDFSCLYVLVILDFNMIMPNYFAKSRTLTWARRFTAKFDFAVSDRYSHEKNAHRIVDIERWADLSTSHHIKPSPKGSGLMW